MLVASELDSISAQGPGAQFRKSHDNDEEDNSGNRRDDITQR